MRSRSHPHTRSLRGYKPLDWSGPSVLTPYEQEIVELQRRDLWRHGIRKEPLLTRMAFEFAATLLSLRAQQQQQQQQAQSPNPSPKESP
jgi:hypothetical protein